MMYTMDKDTRAGFAETGIGIINGEVTEEDVYNAIDRTLMCAGITEVRPFVKEVLARYHYNLSIREATICAMAETIDELDR